MIARAISKEIVRLSKKFPVITVTGPRQSGKTTLIRNLFPDKKYVSLEIPETRLLALSDPRQFLANLPDGAVIDEAQHAPALFSYIQGIVDERNIPGQFILSGSQSFLLHHRITQSLAGRTAILRLFPFSIDELKAAGISFNTYEEYLFTGFFPRIYDQRIKPGDFYPNYMQTCVERDIRSLQNIQDLNAFIRFVGLCAGRVGQILDLTSLGNDCGISVNTAKAWISLLETSYFIFLLHPHYRNFSKRLIKRPKLYFVDPGFCCSLLHIDSREQLSNHYLKGALFENLVLVEFLKRINNQAKQPNLYFWRDHHGTEIDLVIEIAADLLPVEIKSARTWDPGFFSNLHKWNTYANYPKDHSIVLYGGDETLSTSSGRIISWRELDKIKVS
jgi:uncharacterized protein